MTSWLQHDAEGVWRMDYEDMERKLATREVHAAILCSPHNPTAVSYTHLNLLDKSVLTAWQPATDEAGTLTYHVSEPFGADGAPFDGVRVISKARCV